MRPAADGLRRVRPRREEFLIAEPTSHRRLEVGLHNPGLPVTARFRPAHGFGLRRITHRISLPGQDELDAELLGRIGEAYELALAGPAR